MKIIRVTKRTETVVQNTMVSDGRIAYGREDFKGKFLPFIRMENIVEGTKTKLVFDSEEDLQECIVNLQILLQRMKANPIAA